ncbi:hypothetical protein NQ318_017020 [Aromia moschata]|uniref:Uncharacterized protein n=1 Tax=Aromia moschata TaxID=1265417 RepID=A0AAV8XV13_9CUCU|nr:hypothetical protein NQ318_017020 [Aromia moschata]
MPVIADIPYYKIKNLLINTNAGRSCWPISRKISGGAADISRYLSGTWICTVAKKNPPNKLSDDQKLNVLLMLEENHIRRVVKQLQR